MNADEIKGMLADYLGDELGAEDRQRFEEYVDTDREFAAEVASLRCTLDAMRSLKVPDEDVFAAPLRAAARRSWSLPVLRYAAVIVLAFAAGFLARGWSGWEGGPSAPPPAIAGLGREQPPADWQMRFADAYVRNANKSGLARALVSLAQATH
jgi:ferric-dicitrate binding protein FerR (iron transport regulator)